MMYPENETFWPTCTLLLSRIMPAFVHLKQGSHHLHELLVVAPPIRRSSTSLKTPGRPLMTSFLAFSQLSLKSRFPITVLQK